MTIQSSTNGYPERSLEEHFAGPSSGFGDNYVLSSIDVNGEVGTAYRKGAQELGELPVLLAQLEEPINRSQSPPRSRRASISAPDQIATLPDTDRMD